MPPVTILGDQPTLVPTSSYPNYASFPFEKFNPVQSRIFEIYDKEANAIIAAATSAGKTVCAELFMAHEVRQRGGKAMYLAPLRALAKEKIDDWTAESHHFAGLNQSICTGDYRLTAERKKELENSNVIMMTSEMLNSRCRNYKSEQNEWLKDVGTLVVDESHLLTVPGRGDHLEVGLMKFCEVAPQARLVFLSATMPNVSEIAEWVSYTLTGRDTYLINSTYRPCPLGIHWESHYDVGPYETVEEYKVQAALDIVRDYPEDKFLVFVHTKRTGEMMKRALQKAGVDCEFHNADLDKETRQDVEQRFKNKTLRAIVATSTLAWGLNMPARRVIITGVHRGLNEVDTYDVWQMAGRAGRPGYDPRGDVYILLPERKADYHRERLSTPQDIKSRLLDFLGDEKNPRYKTLAFHLVSEIHHGSVSTKEDIRKWYKKSLASFQDNSLHDGIVDSTLDLLMKCGAIKEEDGIYKTNAVGKVSSMFYYSPFDVADLRRNFKFVFDNGYEDNDIAVSMALGAVDTMKMGFVSKAELEEMGTYAAKVNNLYGNIFDGPAIKGGYAYFSMLNGLNPGVFAATVRNLQFDFPRTTTVLNALDTMAGNWNKRQWFANLELRAAYGVRGEMVHICRLPQIGKVRAERLWAAGLRTFDAIAASPGHVQKVLNMKEATVAEICAAAGKMLLTN